MTRCQTTRDLTTASLACRARGAGAALARAGRQGTVVVPSLRVPFALLLDAPVALRDPDQQPEPGGHAEETDDRENE